MNARNFGLIMTSLLSVRTPYVHPSVRNPTMLMRLCLFGGKLHGEIVWQDAFTTEMLKNKNTKTIYTYLLDMLTNVERRERERKRKQKSGDDQAELNVEESDG